MTGVLSGTRIIDFGQYIAGPLATMLLADQGADVIHVDPPGGPRFDTPANATWNRSKRSAVLDLKNSEDLAAARRLVESADVLVENFRPGVMARLGLGAEPMTAANPRLIYCSLPGFAGDHPRAGIAAWEGVVEAAAGAYLRGENAVYSALPLSSSYAAFHGVVSITMALMARERDGAGQFIEAPLFDSTFPAIGALGQRYHDPAFPSLGGLNMTWHGEKETKDGRYVYFHLGNKNVVDFIRAIDAIEWWLEPGVADQVAALFKTKTAQEWEDLAEAVGTELVICRSSAEWMQERHPREAQMFIDVQDPQYGTMLQPGLQVRMARTPGEVRPRQLPNGETTGTRIAWAERSAAAEPAPATPEAPHAAVDARPAANAAPSIPLAVLAGLKVLDLCIVLAGPTCGRTLAEFGANVIKIDGPSRQRPQNPASFAATPPSFNVDVNRGKRSIILDLTTPEGREVFWKLAEDADVIVENYRQGVIDRLGVGYEEVRKRRPDIVYASLNTYGLVGPWSGRPGHEQLAQSATGMSVRFGGDGPPAQQTIAALNDYGTGFMGAYAVALALLHRQRTGEGQHVFTALAYTATLLQSQFMQEYEGKHWDEPRGLDAKGTGPLQRLYRAGDGWFFLGARDRQRAVLASVEGLAGASALADGALTEFLEERFASAPVAVWVERLVQAGLGAHALTSIPENRDNSWVRAHGLVMTRDHPGYGLIDVIGPAARLSRTPPRIGRPAPVPGTDARAILAEHGLLDDLERLVERHAVVLDA